MPVICCEVDDLHCEQGFASTLYTLDKENVGKQPPKRRRFYSSVRHQHTNSWSIFGTQFPCIPNYYYPCGLNCYRHRNFGIRDLLHCWNEVVPLCETIAARKHLH
jgi:hypothetical protein